MITRARSRPGLIFRGSGNTSNSGGGASGNAFFTNDANSNAYFTDDGNTNRYLTTGGGSGISILNVASRGNMMTRVTTSAVDTRYAFKTRRFHEIRAECTQLAAVFCAWYTPPNAAEVDTSDLVYSKMSIEINGVCVPLTFSGGRPVTVLAGTTVISDYIPASAFGLTKFTKGQTMWISTLGSCPAGVTFPSTGLDTVSITTVQGDIFTNESYIRFAPTGAVTEDDIDNVGPKATPTGGVRAYLPHEIMVLGNCSSSQVSIGNYCDSIGDGQGDEYGDVGSSYALAVSGGAGGWMRRAATNAGFPFFQLGQQSARLTGWTSGATKRKALLQYLNVIVCQMAANDILNNRTLLQMQTDYQSIWSDFRSGGIVKIYTSPCTCSVSYSNNTRGDTTADQSPATGMTVGGTRDSYNSWVAGGAGGLTNGHIDNLAGIFDAANKWTLITTSGMTMSVANSQFAVSVVVTGDKPPEGSCLVFESGNATNIDTSICRAISATDPYTVDLKGGGTSKVHAVGTSVNTSRSSDGLHPAAYTHLQMANNAATFYSTISV